MSGDEEEERQDGMDTDVSDFAVGDATVTTVDVDMFLSLDECASSSWNPHQVFTSALKGLFEAMIPGICVVQSQIHADGDLHFARDAECQAPSIDRHGSYLAQKKVKDRASNAIGRAYKSSVYGNSRSPSRASSRAQSRVSAALTSSVMAMKMAKLAFGKPARSTQGDAPFSINEWNDGDTAANRSKAGNHGLDPYAAMSSRFSLASSQGTARTSRMPVDHQEIRRREELSRDIDTREGRERLTARIRRKGDLKLKLRSMVDPSMSFDREEYEAQKKTRGGLMSRGKSRGASNLDATINEYPERTAIARSNSTVSNVLVGTTTSRSNETTYRPEDYEGLHSDLVIMDKKGELLVGENCYLVVRRPRSELQHDLLQKNTIKPRVQVSSQQPGSNGCDSEDNPDGHPSSVEDVQKAPPRYSPRRIASRQSPVCSTDPPAQSPTFEGRSGTFQQYPKIELDPKKTPLAKGVTLKPPEPAALGLPTASALRDIVNPPSHGKTNQRAVPLTGTTAVLAEDRTNDPAESQLQVMIQSSQKTKQSAGATRHQVTANTPLGSHALGETSARTARTNLSKATDYVLPTRNHHGDKQQLQGLRLRTPAYGNRNGTVGSTVLGISHGEFFDDFDSALHQAVDYQASLSTPKNVPSAPKSLPKFPSYVREFPSPPSGQIHVVSSAAATSLVLSTSTTKSTYPFSSLPSVIRGKR